MHSNLFQEEYTIYEPRMTEEETIGGLKRFAEFIVEHAEEFPQCLPLLKEVFTALSTAERRIEQLKQCFIKHHEANRGKSSKSSAAASEEFDGNSTIASTSSINECLTEAEDGVPTKKKRRKIASFGEDTDNDINADSLASDQPDCGQSDVGPESSSPVIKKKKKKKKKHLLKSTNVVQSTSDSIPESVSSVKSEEMEVDENKFDLILNTVSQIEYETDPLLPIKANSEASTEASESCKLSPTTLTKRQQSFCHCDNKESVIPFSSQELELNGSHAPSLIDSEKTSQTMSCKNAPVSFGRNGVTPPAIPTPTGSPGLRVIPSALLMENPQQLDTQPAETDKTMASSHVETHMGDPHNEDQVESGDSDSRNRSNILYFEFDRAVDKRKWLEGSDVISAVKKDEAMHKYWITVDNMKRSGMVISGYLVFPDRESCFRTYRNGLAVCGFFAWMKPVISLFADDASPSYEPLGGGPFKAENWTRNRGVAEPSLIDDRMSPQVPGLIDDRRSAKITRADMRALRRNRGSDGGQSSGRGGGCSSGRGGGHIRGHGGAHSSGRGVGHNSGRGVGHSSEHGVGRSSGRGGGHSSERGVGHSRGRGGGHSSGHGGVRSSGHGGVRSSGRGVGHSTERGVGHSSERGVGHSSERGVGHSSERGVGNSNGRGGGHSNGRGGGHSSGRGSERGYRRGGGAVVR